MAGEFKARLGVITPNIRLTGTTSGYVGLAPAAAAGSTTYTLPAADGTSGQVLSTNGSGVLSWATASGGGTYTTNGIPYASSTSALSTGSALTFDGTNFATTGSITSSGVSAGSGTITTTGRVNAGTLAVTSTGKPSSVTALYQPSTYYLGFSIANLEPVRIGGTGLSLSRIGRNPQAQLDIYTDYGQGSGQSLQSYTPSQTNGFAINYAGGSISGITGSWVNACALDNPSISIDDTVDAATLATATTLYIDGAPTGASLTTITNAYALYVNSGKSFFGGNITGDFSNATLSSRANFQSSTLNGVTIVSLIPNGTGTQSRLNVLNVSSTTNYALGSLLATATDVRLVSDAAGTGTQLPMTFYTNGLGRFVMGTAGQFGIGPLATVSYGTAGQLFVSGGASAAPSWTSASSASIATYTGTETLTNKKITARVQPVTVAAATTSQAWNSDSYDQINLTLSNTNTVTIALDSGTTPTDGQKVMFRIKDDGTVRSFAWTTTGNKYFRAVGVTLPTSTTTANKITYVGCVYNSTGTGTWDVIATGREV